MRLDAVTLSLLQTIGLLLVMAVLLLFSVSTLVEVQQLRRKIEALLDEREEGQ